MSPLNKDLVTIVFDELEPRNFEPRDVRFEIWQEGERINISLSGYEGTIDLKRYIEFRVEDGGVSVLLPISSFKGSRLTGYVPVDLIPLCYLFNELCGYSDAEDEASCVMSVLAVALLNHCVEKNMLTPEKSSSSSLSKELLTSSTSKYIPTMTSSSHFFQLKNRSKHYFSEVPDNLELKLYKRNDMILLQIPDNIRKLLRLHRNLMNRDSFLNIHEAVSVRDLIWCSLFWHIRDGESRGETHIGDGFKYLFTMDDKFLIASQQEFLKG